MLVRFHPRTRQDFIFRDVGKQCFLIRQFGFRIIRSFYVGTQKPFKFNRRTRHLKYRAVSLHCNRRLQFTRIHHLAGDRAFPDQAEQAKLVTRKLAFQSIRQRKRMACRTNRLVRFLRVTHFVGVGPWLLGKITVAIFRTHQIPRRLNGDLCQRRGVCPHVGDMPILVKTLRGVHRPPGREPQLAIRLLLQGTGRKRRFRLFPLWLDGKLAHPEVRRA